jgi:hypothetical protein
MMRVLLLFTVCMIVACTSSNHVKIHEKDCNKYGITAHQQNVHIHQQSMEQGQVYLLRNISQETLLLNQVSGHNPSAAAGWASELAPRRYSALRLSQDHFAISCQLAATHRQIDCSSVLTVCGLPANNTDNTQGSYWLLENQSFSGIMPAVQAQAR